MQTVNVIDYSDMKQELKRRTKQYRVMKERNQELCDEMQSFKSTLEHVQQSEQSKSNDAINQAQQCRRAEVKFDALKLQIGDLNRRRKVLQHEVDRLTGSLAVETQRADALQSKVVGLEQERKQQDDAGTLKRKALKIQKENQELKQNTRRMEQQITQMETDRFEKGNGSVGAHGKENFAKERIDLLKRIAVQTETLSKRDEETALLKQSCENAHRQVEKMAKSRETTEATEELAALKAGVKQYKKQAKTLMVEKLATGKRMQELECQVLQSDGDELQTRCNEQHVVIQELHREVQRHKEQMNALQQTARSKSEVHSPKIPRDDNHVGYLTENIAALELQMAQMLSGLAGIEKNASAIVVGSEKITSDSQVEARTKHNAQTCTKASNNILMILETLS